MEPQIKNSFIPRSTFTAPRPVENSIGLVNLIAFIVLGASLLLFAIVFGYRFILISSLNRPCGEANGCGLRESFAREIKDLNIVKVTRLVNVDTKLKTARSVVENHISLLPLFVFLENHTLHSVRFTDLAFTRGGTLSLSGFAKNYEDIAIQSKAFRENQAIKNVVFSDFGQGESGNIKFTVDLTLSEELLKYKTNTN